MRSVLGYATALALGLSSVTAADAGETPADLERAASESIAAGTCKVTP